jgi:DNA integrity scanning protein DisA with diadenylate cyclase activity
METERKTEKTKETSELVKTEKNAKKSAHKLFKFDIMVGDKECTVENIGKLFVVKGSRKDAEGNEIPTITFKTVFDPEEIKNILGSTFGIEDDADIIGDTGEVLSGDAIAKAAGIDQTFKAGTF